MILTSETLECFVNKREYQKEFKSIKDYLSKREHFQIKINNFTFLNMEPLTDIKGGKIIHVKKNGKFFSFCFIKNTSDVAEYHFFIAHEFAHWVIFIESGANLLDPDSQQSKYLTNVELNYFKEKLDLPIIKSIHGIQHVIPENNHEIRQRFKMSEFPVCSLARLFILPRLLLESDFEEFFINIEKFNEMEKFVDLVIKKYIVPMHVVYMRIEEEQLIDEFVKKNVIKKYNLINFEL